MNERIKELLLEAASYGSSKEPTDYIASQLILYEKFAELIIRDCMVTILNNDIEKAETYDENSPYFAGWERGVIDSASTLANHFGLKNDQ